MNCTVIAGDLFGINHIIRGTLFRHPSFVSQFKERMLLKLKGTDCKWKYVIWWCHFEMGKHKFALLILCTPAKKNLPYYRPISFFIYFFFISAGFSVFIVKFLNIYRLQSFKLLVLIFQRKIIQVKIFVVWLWHLAMKKHNLPFAVFSYMFAPSAHLFYHGILDFPFIVF